MLPGSSATRRGEGLAGRRRRRPGARRTGKGRCWRSGIRRKPQSAFGEDPPFGLPSRSGYTVQQTQARAPGQLRSRAPGLRDACRRRLTPSSSSSAPTRLSEFIGQAKAKQQLAIALRSRQGTRRGARSRACSSGRPGSARPPLRPSSPTNSASASSRPAAPRSPSPATSRPSCPTSRTSRFSSSTKSIAFSQSYKRSSTPRSRTTASTS